MPSSSLICILVVINFLLVYIERFSCTNFTIIYDRMFREQFVNSTVKNNGSNVKFHEINLDYDNAQSVTGYLEKNISESDVVFLFTKQDAFFAWILQDQHMVLNYGVSLSKMIENNLRMKNSLCHTFDQSLQRTITTLIYSLSYQKVAVVTVEQNCATEFYTLLENSTSQHFNSDLLHVKMKHVVFNPGDNEFIGREYFIDSGIYSLSDVDVIIPLIPQELIPILLRAAFTIRTIPDSTYWVVPSDQENMLYFKGFPANTLSYEIIGKNHYKIFPYSRLHTGVYKAISVYEKLKDTALSRHDILMQMHQTVQRTEEEDSHSRKLNLKLRYRDMASLWSEVTAILDQQWLYIKKSNIPILRPVTERTTYEIIRAVTIFNPPYVLENFGVYESFLDICLVGQKCEKPVVRNNSVVYKKTCCTGFVMDILSTILRDTDLRVNLYVVEDNKFGGLREDGSWTGMIGDILAGKADMAVASVSITGIRSKVVDFSQPYAETQMGIMIRPEVVKAHFMFNFQFVSSLSLESKCLILVVTIGTVFLHYFLENIIFFVSLTKSKYMYESYYALYESATYISGVLLQRDLGGKVPDRIGAKLTAVGFAMGMVIFITSYTATMTAGNVQYVEKNAFQGSSDDRMRNPTPAFRFGVLAGGSYESFFKHSENEVIRKMSYFMEPYNEDTIAKGVQSVIDRNLEGFIANYETLAWRVVSQKLLDFKVQRDDLRKGGYGFAMKKNFKWKHQINKAILRYRESPKSTTLQEKWFSVPPQITAKSTRLGLYNFGGLIFILCFTVMLCFLMLIPENLCNCIVNMGFYERLMTIKRDRMIAIAT